MLYIRASICDCINERFAIVIDRLQYIVHELHKPPGELPLGLPNARYKTENECSKRGKSAKPLYPHLYKAG